ncbi:MAG: hypothetical protein R3322_00265 [Kiloniellales bacterium]|nr:hypothetical protein [Kiloniellales bacterium]
MAPEIVEQATKFYREKRQKRQKRRAERYEKAMSGTKKVSRSSLRVGQSVYFQYKTDRVPGRIRKLNPKNAKVEQTTDKPYVRGQSGKGLTWNVPYESIHVKA